jgi:hypothetical protein
MSNKTKISEIVEDYIEKYRINDGNYENIRNTTKKHLINIEKFLQSYINYIEELANKVKKSKLNLLTITQNTAISRSTVYNNPDILKVYIEKRIDEIESKDILSLNKLDKKEKEIIELREYLENIQIHLVKTEILEAKINELEKEIGDLKATDEAHIMEISRLKKENQRLLLELNRNRANNVIGLNPPD